MVGAYVMTQANCQGREVVDDGIALAAYTMDSHNCQRIVIEKDGQKMVKNEGNVEIGGFGPYPIAYRSITPKSDECTNLLVPVCLSASHIAYGSIRMEPVFMALAQSAAIAASIAIDEGIRVQDVDAAQIRQTLKSDPLLDGTTPEVLVDDADTTQVTTTGEWKRSTTGAFGPSLLIDESKGKTHKSVRFSPSITVPGKYGIFVYYVPAPDIASETKVAIFDGVSVKDTAIVRSDVVVEGQTSGEFIFLGDYDLPAGGSAYVEISNDGADGAVIADAVLWVPRR